MRGNRTMRATSKLASVSALILAATACDQMLGVENLSNPDIDLVFATPSAVEQTIGSGYQACHNPISNTSLTPPPGPGAHPPRGWAEQPPR